MSATSRPAARSNDYYAALKSRARDIEARYRALTPASAALVEKAKAVFPGGYTRDSIIRKPYATFFTTGEGAVITDADGRKVVDFWFNATSLPVGHAHPKVVAAATQRIKQGTAFYAPTENEIGLAQMLIDRIPCAERVRFTNSGSEAVMLAIRMARGHTGRDLIVKCEGSYHGTYDDAQWSVGPAKEAYGPADDPTPVADTAGLPAAGKERVRVIPFDDAAALKRTVRLHGPRIAAIIIEPMANRIGLVVPSKEFFQAARDCANECGAVLIFDEVIAFRLGYNGAQGHVGVTPDLTTLGKVIGGGFPVGGVVGRQAVMSVSDAGRKGRVTHAGTFNANPVTVAAGKATMEALTPAEFDRINATGERIRQRLTKICDGLPLTVTGAGSVFKINAIDRPIKNYRDTADVDGEWEELASQAILCEGYMLTTHLHGCVATVTTEDQIEGFLQAVEKVVRQ